MSGSITFGLDDVRGLLDNIITLQIKNNEYVIRKGTKLLLDCNQYFHLQNGCYSKDKDDVMGENGCMVYYYQTIFIITEQIFSLFKAGWLLFCFVLFCILITQS